MPAGTQRADAERFGPVVERTPAGQDGRSGSRVERIRLADGARLVVKRTSRAYDRVAQATADDGREARLFLSGVLDRLPAGVGHAILDAWSEVDGWVVVMRDVSAGLVPNDHVATYGEVDRLLTALSALHGAYAGGPPPDGLCPLPVMLGNLFPGPMAAVHVEHEFPRLVLRGWDCFHQMVPADVSAGVREMHADPAGLAARLAGYPSTLLHGDCWMVNCALLPDEVVLLDWPLATWGPPAVDLAVFLAGHGARMAPSREHVLDRFRELSGRRHDAGATRLALSHGLASMGWNKALDAATHADPGVRARERADLGWWVDHFDPS